VNPWLAQEYLERAIRSAESASYFDAHVRHFALEAMRAPCTELERVQAKVDARSAERAMTRALDYYGLAAAAFLVWVLA
jgi:hypothetical protein